MKVRKFLGPSQGQNILVLGTWYLITSGQETSPPCWVPSPRAHLYLRLCCVWTASPYIMAPLSSLEI